MTQSLTLLEGHKYISLTTFRKSGEPKPVPVWFTEMDGRIYVFTGLDSWKVKRIKNNTNVEMSPCESNGTVLTDEKITGTARILTTNEDDIAIQSFKKKYGLMKMFFDLAGKLRGNQNVYLEIVPHQEEMA